MSRQFVVQVTNQPGQMARLAEEMAAAGVDLRAIGGGGLGDVGSRLRCWCRDSVRARAPAPRSRPARP